MQPVAYIDHLNRLYQSHGFPAYDWTVNDDAPFTPLVKPLAECRVSMLTTCGVSRIDAEPFDPDARNDFRLDAIAWDTPADYFQVHDNYYDHRDVRKDINCQFPIERLRELANEGVFAEVAPRLWSGFMGRIYKRRAILEEAAPAFARELASNGADLLIVIPACPLDHQTAGLVARVVEESGIPTITISTARDISKNVKPPRTAFVNFPMGNACGAPGDGAQQRRIVLDALLLAENTTAPGVIHDLPYVWPKPIEVFYKETSREYQLKNDG